MTRRIKWIGIACILVALAIYSQAQQLPLRTADGMWLALGTNQTAAGWAPLYPIWRTALMTSTNTPAPNTTAADVIYSVGWESWRAFNNTYADGWASTISAFPHWIEYDCGVGNSNVARSISINSYSTFGVNAFTLSGSVDRVNYVQLLSTNGANNAGLIQTWTPTTTGYYRFFRVTANTGYGTLVGIMDMVISSALPIPKMTATNAPSPLNSTADAQTTGSSYTAFDYDNTTGWNPFPATSPNWIQLDVGSNVVCKGFDITCNPTYAVSNIVWAGSTDGSAFTTIFTTNGANVGTVQTMTNNNTTAYRYYKWTVTAWGTYNVINELRLWRYE